MRQLVQPHRHPALPQQVQVLALQLELQQLLPQRLPPVSTILCAPILASKLLLYLHQHQGVLSTTLKAF